jgi:hypothetical protein
VDSELSDSPGSEPHATLAANLGSSSLETIRSPELPDAAIGRQINSMQGVHVLLDALLPAEESRDRYTLTQLHGRGGMGQVWLAKRITRHCVPGSCMRPRSRLNLSILESCLSTSSDKGKHRTIQ